MIATYKLSDHLASFEFFNWLVMVKAEGATEIHFDLRNPKLKNFTQDDVINRFNSIIRPGPDLAGLAYYFSTQKGLDASGQYFLSWFKRKLSFARLKSPKNPVTVDFTVTIRDNKAGAHSRDSNRAVWTKFAERIGAVVIDDYYNKPIHLHDRMALYAGSKMNFGVCNGPVHLLSLTQYPVAMFVNGPSARNSQLRWGMKVGEKYPWMLSNQHMIWKDDNDLGVLLRCFDDLKM